MHADHGWDAILARYHRAMRHEPADLHHQPTRRQEQRSPSRIGPRADQDLTRRELGPMRVKYDMDDPLRHARRHRAAGDGCARLIAKLCNSVKKRSTIAEQQAWHLAASLFAPVRRPPFANQSAPISLFPLGQRFDLFETQEKGFFGLARSACFQRLPAM